MRPAPALSPYLNLVRGGNPAVNYYLGVLTEFDRRAFEGQMLAQPEFGLRPQQRNQQPDDLIFNTPAENKQTPRAVLTAAPR